MSSTQRQVGDVLSELARDNYRGLIDPHTYRLQRARLIDQLVVDDDEEASSTTRPQAPTKDRRSANPPLSDPANQRRRDVDRVREQIETEEVLQIVAAARRQAREAADAASAASAKSVPPSGTASPTTTAPRRSLSPEPAPASTGSSQTPLIAGIVAAIVVIGGIAVVMSGGDEDPAPYGEARDTAVPATAGERLLGDFVNTNNWTDGAVSALADSWAQLLPSQRQAAQDSVAYRSFAFEVRRRLLENAALRELEGGDNDGSQALLTLAQVMGMPVPQPEGADPESVAGTAAFEATLDVEPTPVPQPFPQPVPQSVPAQQTMPSTAPEALAGRRKDTAPSASTETAADNARAALPVAPELTPREVPPADSAPTPPADDAVVPAQAADTPVTAPADSGCHAALLTTRQRSCSDVLRVGGDGPRMAIIKPGSFTMGSKWAPEEGPAHSVTLDASFGIASHEVSYDEYQRFCSEADARCPANPWSSGDYPVVDVSWEEASAYARWLSAQTGRRYRLPTEAEWEFAARAGVESRYPLGDELLPVQARYASGLGAEKPWPRSYRDAPRNRFGLYNSIGNVREWVADAWHDTHAGAPADGSARDGTGARVVRGGSFADEPSALRLSSRIRLDGAARDGKTGFRVALDF